MARLRGGGHVSGTPGFLVRVAFAVTVMLLAVFLRAGLTSQTDLDLLHEFNQILDLDVGPETPWFAAGIHTDGSAFALIAADPLGSGVGRKLYTTSYRYARAGYSWLSNVVALGRENLILFGLSMVGLISIGLIAYLAVGLRESLGWPAWLLILNPALYAGFLGDSAEPLGLALLIVSLASASVTSTVLLSVVRPTYLMAVTDRAALAIVGIVVAVAFRTLWILRFGDSLSEGALIFDWPMAGAWKTSTIVAWAVAASGLITLLVGLRNRRLSWVVSGFLVVSLGQPVLGHWASAFRAAGLLPVLWAFGLKEWKPVSIRSLFRSAGRVPVGGMTR